MYCRWQGFTRFFSNLSRETTLFARMSADTDIQVIDFLHDYLPQLKALAEARGIPQDLPDPRKLSDFERAQVRLAEQRLDLLLKPKGQDTFDEDDEEIPSDPFIFTATQTGLIAAKRYFEGMSHVTLVDEADWRTWVQQTFQGKKPILRGFRRYFMFFTNVLGEIDLKEQVSGMRLKGMQYIQLHEGEQLTLQNQKSRETSWGWDGKNLDLADDEE
ncbi:MAG: hypothetical protein KF690_00615 [Bacteroidetes bacterium]|nr:hypothetical protein [Bacteroidota bacterium]